MASRALVIRLPSGEYRRLAERAEKEDRDPHQEARHLIRAAIAADADSAPRQATEQERQ